MRVVKDYKRGHIPHVNVVTKIDYAPLTGGLDDLHSAVSIPTGRMLYGINFEERFGRQGYHRIDGFERYDGRPQPHQAKCYTQFFELTTAQIVAGSIVTGASVTAMVVSATLITGSWLLDGVGVMVLTDVVGSFVQGEDVLVAAVSVAKASGATIRETMGDDDYQTNLQAAISITRANIAAVPGSGSILGIGIFNGVVYAARNAADGKTAAIYSGSTTGWKLLQGGLIPGGRWRFDVSNFTGSAKTLSLFGCDGRNNPIVYDGTTVAKIRAVWPTVATSTSSVAVATGDQTFVLVEADRDYKVADAVTVWDDTNAANNMVGVVKTWTPGTKTLVVTVATINGTGTIATWTVGKTDFTDKPYDLLNFKDHLFLSFPLGQLKTSDIGDPLLYTTTAALFGMGFEITGMLALKGDALAIYGGNAISLLTGTNQLDWALDVLSTNSGAAPFTAVEVAGIGIHADSTGIRSLQAMQAYDGYEASAFSREAKKTFDAFYPSAVNAVTVKDSQQYRLYGRDGKVLVCTVITPNAAVTPADVAFSVLDYGINIACAANGYLSNGEGVNFFGTEDGFVMREGVGTSFDGEAITSAVMLPFNHFKSPANTKRFRKLGIDLDADGTVSISFKQHFDYSDGFYPSSINQGMTAIGKGGVWDVSQWDTIQWSQPLQNQGEANISGVGRNMGLLLWHSSAVDAGFTLQGVMIHYSILGMVR